MAKTKPPVPEGALYVRLPAQATDKLDRAASALGMHKKDLIAGLVTKYVDPENRKALQALGTLAQPKRPNIDISGPSPSMGTYSYQAYDAPEPTPDVLTVAQAAQLLQVDPKVVLELAESKQLPGRKLGTEWRFARAAVLAWLAG